MLARCESCGEEIESDDWLLLRGEAYHGTGSCRDLYMRQRDRIIIKALFLARIEGGSDA